MYDIYDNDFDKAFDEAVEAIEKKEHRLIYADKLIELIDDGIASLDMNMSTECYYVCLCTLQMVKLYIEALPTVEPVKMMCNGEHIKCPAHKDYERGYKDGQAEAQMKVEPIEIRAAIDQKAYNKGYADGIADSVKHGRWIKFDYYLGIDVYKCSECGMKIEISPNCDGTECLLGKFCENCGARMDAPNNAHWIKQPNGEYKCSVCGDTTLAPLYKCGTCGARMDGGENG